MVHLFAVLGLAVALAGCDAARSTFPGRADKVRAAFPLPQELADARDALLAALGRESPPASKEVAAQLALQLESRVMACSNTADIGIFDSAATVKRKAGVSDCIREHDARLSEWLGSRRVILALRRPARVPPGPLPLRMALPPQPDGRIDVAIAEAANLVAVRGYRQPVTMVSLPRGEILATLAAPTEHSRRNSLSPNGAVVVVPAGPHMSFIDTESGITLWKSARYQQVLAWLPEFDATVLADTKSMPAYLDHRKGTVEGIAAIPRADWALPLPDGRLLLGYDVRMMLAEHSRRADGGLAVQAVKQWRLQRSINALHPLLMANGKLLVYQAVMDLAWLDLASGEQGLWDLRQLAPSGFAKVSDTQVYMELHLPATLGGPQPYVFDVARGTVMPAEPDAYPGSTRALAPHSGYTRGGYGKLTLVTGALALGQEKPLPDMIADVQVARMLAKPRN